ncbi:hypothetical protein BIY23_00950 [Wolbachia pipientis]|uniref:Uncharacterized protein n=1 Tax=Wolbachia pipientis TaxID=955 RepID=A0A1E7QKP0_WOLPI|nr:ankyrin repeat domain-containing protein [Wolbachia pipientis]OEY87041.1 hypothetical protein BIY23_00950 [Wolbachia pipientis]
MIIGDKVLNDEVFVKLGVKLEENKLGEKCSTNNILGEVYSLLPIAQQKEWNKDGNGKLNPNHVFTVGYHAGKRTLLESAAMKGHSSLIRHFVDAGVDVNKTGSSDEGSILLTIATIGRYSCISELLKCNANIKAEDSNGNTILHVIAANNMGFKENNNLKILELLMQPEYKNKLNINAKNDNGEAPLHLAANNGYKEVASLLVRNGADHLIKDNKHCAAIDYVKEHVKEEWNRDVFTPSTALEAGKIERIEQEKFLSN